MISSQISKPPSKRRIHVVVLLLALITYLITASLYLARPQILDDIEGRLVDARFKVRGPIETSGLVTIVAVDEQSIEKVGRWPWSREVVGKVIRRLGEMNAGAVGLDIIFSEPQFSEIDTLIKGNTDLTPAEYQYLKAIRDKHTPDLKLIEAIRKNGRIINGQFFYTTEETAKQITPLTPEQEALLVSQSAVDAVRARSENYPTIRATGVRMNIPEIARAGNGAGYFNFIPARDGTIRNAYLVLRYQDELYPSLALKSLSMLLGDAPIVVSAEAYGIDHISIGDIDIPTDELGGFVLNYRGPAKTIPTYSAYDVLQGSVPADAFDGKMVLLGVTAIGVYDAHTTPFGPGFPGLEIQANAAENIILGDYIHHSGLEILLDLVVLFIILLILALSLPRLGGVFSRFFVAAGTLLAYTAFNYYLFATQQLWINLTYPILGWTLLYVSLTIYLSVIVERRYSTVHTAFQFYLHPELVNELTNNPELLQFGGEQKYLTILFSDIRNFTNISEGLTPQQLAKFIHCYMDPMTEQVLNHRGTLDKYIGDAVMAIFGAPLPSTTHPSDACAAALDMIDRLDTVQACCPEIGHIFPIHIGVGLHSGDVVVGNLGSSHHFTYTVLGDNVNLASRLEGLTKQYGVHVLISESTYQHVAEEYVCRELDLVRVKGKQIPIRIYELVARKGAAVDTAFITRWDTALAAYRDMRWPEAIAQFEQLQRDYPDNVSCALYAERSHHYQETPPAADWDRVTTFSTK